MKTVENAGTNLFVATVLVAIFVLCGCTGIILGHFGLILTSLVAILLLGQTVSEQQKIADKVMFCLGGALLYVGTIWLADTLCTVIGAITALWAAFSGKDSGDSLEAAIVYFAMVTGLNLSFFVMGDDGGFEFCDAVAPLATAVLAIYMAVRKK